MREFKLLTDERFAEALAEGLMNEGALSAVIEDADADQPDEKPLFGEPGMEPDNCAWPNSIVSILADDDFLLETTLPFVIEEVKCPMPKIISIEEVEDADWVRITQAQFPPTQVSDRLWIVPTWHELPNENAINIRLDPGVAFGTGSHPTTHLCLSWLDQNVTANDTVLDYGCGTGILAIAAKRLGAKSILGTDIDPQAVEAAQDNAKMNEVEGTFMLPNEMPEGTFDVVVANILSNPLKLLAPALLARVKKNGALVLSGVLARQAEEVIEVYRTIDPQVKLSVWQEKEGWVCIAGRRQA